MQVSRAETADIPELVALINSAYRGSNSKKGWTTEADLITGEIRTDESDLAEQMNQPGAQIIKCTEENKTISGCVYLKKKDEKLYLGMLTVSPGKQSLGIGKILLGFAENHARQNQCRHIQMYVIDLRTELISWYEKHGYSTTGKSKPFPVEAGFGKPTKPLVLVELQKKL
jgi:ribosomal protein S18 acetylase RimI-like enzyme